MRYGDPVTETSKSIENTDDTAKSENAIRFERLLYRARAGLIDTAKRNRLIHTPRPSKRSNALDIVDELSDETFRILVTEGRPMSFLPGAIGAEGNEGVSADEMDLYLPPEDDGDGIADRHLDSRLQTRLTPEGLQKRMLALHRDATTIEEEQGISVLYLALGFLRWYESPSSDRLRESPLLLVPISLERSSAKAGFKVRFRDEDLNTNLSLAEMLKNEFGIELPEIDIDDDWSPTLYFEKVRQAVASQSKWSIDDDGMVLGFFSFAKLLMYRDLDPANWPDGMLVDHPLLSGLLNDGFASSDPIFPEDTSIDEFLDPADLIHIVDADASQTEVIERVRRGDNLVIQGPPGTGKSQTITNIIASAVYDGKSVLFMAEKMAALDVVQSRLEKGQLGRIMLELHSRKANKREVLEELGRTLNQSVEAKMDEGLIDELRDKRDRLNVEAKLMHQSISAANDTPYQVLGGLARLMEGGHPPPDLALPDTRKWTADNLAEISEDVARLVDRTKKAGQANLHPWRGVTALNIQRPDVERLGPKLENLTSRIEAFDKLCCGIAESLGKSTKYSIADVDGYVSTLEIFSQAPDLSARELATLSQIEDTERVASIARDGSRYLEIADKIDPIFISSAWDIDIAPMRMTIAGGNGSLFRRLGGTYRKAVSDLKSLATEELGKDRNVWVSHLDLLLEGKKIGLQIDECDGSMRTVLGPIWQGRKTSFQKISQALDWAEKLNSADAALTADAVESCLSDHSSDISEDYKKQSDELLTALKDVDAVLQLDTTIAFGMARFESIQIRDLASRAKEWGQSTDLIHEWSQLKSTQNSVLEHGLSDLVERLGDGRLAPEIALNEFSYARAEQLWQDALNENPALATLDGDEKSQVVADFRRLDARRRDLAVKQILLKHDEDMPRGAAGPMRTIRSEIAKKRRHLPIRKLMKNAGTEIQRIKPVMLMSPMSIAQFLPPGTINFDVLVIDEASQVKPEDALGAIARSKQIVVVGDSKQLPPSRFFEKMVGGEADEEEDEGLPSINVGDLESILTLCESSGMSQSMLSWHYRSRHPSLITVSNELFYESGLFLPPAPVYESDQLGFTVNHIAGEYDKGGKRINDIEAKAIVAALVEHIRNYPNRSIGVVTFSMAQRTHIQNLLELERRKVPELDRLFSVGVNGEPAFVKNLENVQGDERDYIFVSVCYGPTSAGGGLPTMNFGPVSREGGERRLNVLFSRARYRCEIFVSFHSGDIDVERSSTVGPGVLKRFLRYGETGQLDMPEPTGLGADSPFEEAVANAIIAMGYEVDLQVGSAGFRIDLAIKHPKRKGQYILAVECDGATYHSARWARERDRLRQEVLEGMGWAFHRIWSTDWFNRPESEKEKLQKKVHFIIEDELRKEEEAVEQAELDEQQHEIDEIIVVDMKDSDLNLPAYKEATIGSGLLHLEPHEVPLSGLAKLVGSIVEFEGPVHTSEIARRFANAWGKNKVGNRILSHTEDALKLCAKGGEITRLGEFWDQPDRQYAPQIRSRSNASVTLKKAAMLPPTEIKALADRLTEHNGEMSVEDLVPTIAKAFGFLRTGSDLKEVIQKAIGK